jgi:UDP:flavonoid glycosyltransferase YjiC (YdhE family)
MKGLIAAFPGGIDDAWRACQGADAIISSFTSDLYATSITEKLDVPQLSAWLQPPFVPTRDGAATNNAPLPRRHSVINALFTRFFVEPVQWQLYGEQDARLRRDVLGLPPQGWSRARATLARTPRVLGYSRHVVPHPADWPATLHTTGYWFLDAVQGWTPPLELTAFLTSGAPPICIGFGSMTTEDAQGLTRLIVAAVERAGGRAVLLGGWGRLGAAALPATIFSLDAAPHGWLFPRMAAVVHHGGAGTTAEGLRAGIPTVVVPHLGDQPFWGRRVAELGVGPKPIPKGRLTADRLVVAIRQAAADVTIRDRAQALGQQIRAEDGVALAVEQIERALGRMR